MAIPHEPWLVALSIAIAIQGSFVGLSLAVGFDSASGFRRRVALAGSALTLATGIWSMHFVGMLAASFPSAVDYLVLPTLVSFLICVIVVGVGVYAAHNVRMPKLRDRRSARSRWGSASRRCIMSACRRCILRGRPIRSRPSSSASFVVSVAASAFALLALGGRPNRLRLFVGAVVLGLAISGMHYTAMAGMRLDPLCFDASRFVGAEFGAVAQHPRAARDGDLVRRLRRLPAFAGARRRPQGAATGDRRRAADGAARPPKSPLSRRAKTAPRGAAPTAAQRSASRRTAAPAISRSPTSTPSAPTRITPMSTTASTNISATRPISALEARLDAADFLRVHRSYIVRLDRVCEGEARGRGRGRRTRRACALQHSGGARPLSRAQRAHRGAFGPAPAPLFVKCVSLADAFRAQRRLLAPFCAR